MPKSAQRTWGGRFSSGPAEAVRKFTESVSFDWRLYQHDIAGSIAHARGLAKAGIITKREAGKIERGLLAIERKIDAGKFAWDPSLEDVHMNIEPRSARPAANSTPPGAATIRSPPISDCGCATRASNPCARCGS